MSSHHVLKLNEENFSQEVLSSDKPVLVDFWAEWCPPCHVLAPTIEALAAELEGQVKIGKIDVEANPKLAADYQIRSIPTLVFFQNGAEVERIIGVADPTTLKKRLRVLAAAA